MNKKSSFVIVASLMLMLVFQNCGFRVSSSSPENQTSSLGVSNPMVLDWDPFQKATDKLAVNVQPYLGIEYFTDSQAIVHNENSYFLFDAKTNQAKKILSANGFTFTNDGMFFPTLGRMAIVVRYIADNTNHLIVVDVNSGAILYQSEPLALIYAGCVYNAQDEADGIILCPLAKPTATDANEIQAAIFDIKTLKFTKLAPLPDGYNLKAEWASSGPFLYGYENIFPFTKELKAIVSARDTQNNEVQFVLTKDRADIYVPTTKFDFKGTGLLQTLEEFRNSGAIGRKPLKAVCTGASTTYASNQHFYSFTDGIATQGDVLCLQNQDWTSPTSGKLMKCTNPSSCVDQSLQFENTSLKSSGDIMAYLSYDKSMLISATIGNYSGYVLQKVNTVTGEVQNIDLGETIVKEDVTNINGIVIFKNTEIRKKQNSLVVGYKAFFPGSGKIRDLPIISNSAIESINWYQRRYVNSVNYLIGLYSTAAGHKTVIVNELGEYEWLTDSQILQRDNDDFILGSSKIFLVNANKDIEAYDFVTKARTKVGVVPAGLSPSECVEVGDKFAVIMYNSANNTRNLQVFKNGSLIFDRVGAFSDFKPFKDSTGILVWTNDYSNALMYRYDLQTDTLSDSVPCDLKPSSCVFETYQTAQGEMIATQFGLIYDSKMKLVFDTGLMNINEWGASIGGLRKVAYYLKWTQSPTDKTITLSSLYKYEFATKQLTQITNLLEEDYMPLGDYYLTMKRPGGKTIGGSLSDPNGMLLDIPDLESASYSSERVIIQTTSNGVSKYRSIERGKKQLSVIAEAPKTVIQYMGSYGNFLRWKDLRGGGSGRYFYSEPRVE